jgi:hypothetical protein
MKSPTLTFLYSSSSRQDGTTPNSNFSSKSKEKRNGISLFARFIHNPLNGGRETAISEELHEVCNVDDEGARNRRCRNPNAILVKNLESFYLALT